jgi:hypothetical protein
MLYIYHYSYTINLRYPPSREVEGIKERRSVFVGCYDVVVVVVAGLLVLAAAAWAWDLGW